MNFRIEATKPTVPADLKAVLEAARDEWVETTPQESDSDYTVPGTAAHALHNIEAVRMSGAKSETLPILLKSAVDAHKALVKKNSVTLDEAHAGAVDLINCGIAAAVAMAARSKVKVRASVVGHFDVSLDGIRTRPGERVSVHVDSAG